MRLLHEIAILQTLKSEVIISLFETVRLSVSISLRNLYNSLNSIKEKLFSKLHFKLAKQIPIQFSNAYFVYEWISAL